MSNGRGRSKRMAKEWSFIPATVVAMTANATFVGGSLLLAGPATILRVIGEYIIGNTVAGVSASDSAIVTVALGVMSSDAVALGASAMPDPGAEGEYPWLYYSSHPFWFNTAGTPAYDEAPRAAVRKSFDVRSMRKMKARESLGLVLQYEDVVGAPPLEFVPGNFRVLLAT